MYQKQREGNIMDTQEAIYHNWTQMGDDWACAELQLTLRCCSVGLGLDESLGWKWMSCFFAEGSKG